MKTLLWLDDYRDPMKDSWLVFSPISQPFNVIWVKSYVEFVNWIKKEGLPDAICFDHDLGEDQHEIRVKAGMNKKLSRKHKQLEKTGHDCAKWLVNYCLDHKKKLPLYNIQSANPVGKENIRSLLEQFKRS